MGRHAWADRVAARGTSRSDTVVLIGADERDCDDIRSAGHGVEAAPPQDVGLGGLPLDGRDLPAAAGPAARRGRRHRAGQKVLDVAAGTGNASIVAAEKGAEVTASDLTPELFEAGRERAKAAGVELEWVEADAENLPFEDESFDVVMSSIGAMFAPRHQDVADQLVRVCRPGGTVALLSWTPEGMIGALFRAMGPFAPPPPPGAQPPPLWGSEDHVRELFGDRVDWTTLEREDLEITPSKAARVRRALHREVRPYDRRPRQRREGRTRRGARPSPSRLLRRVESRLGRRRPLRAGVPGLGRHPGLRTRCRLSGERDSSPRSPAPRHDVASDSRTRADAGCGRRRNPRARSSLEGEDPVPGRRLPEHGVIRERGHAERSIERIGCALRQVRANGPISRRPRLNLMRVSA